MNQASARSLPGTPADQAALQQTPVLRSRGVWLLIAGAAAFLAIMASYVAYKERHVYAATMDPVDLQVYTIGGLILRHVSPWYNAHLAYPLYDWPGYTNLKLQFTYTPFAAEIFAVLSFVPWLWLPRLWVLANVGFLVLTLWFTFGGLGYGKPWSVRAGATLLTAAVVFWTEPVIRTIYLGQINLALMALIMWDLTQPDRRWWKGAGVGIAAGIKLVPLIFIPYLLVTRRFKQAIAASATFAATIAAGFVFLPADSAKWWFTGLFFSGSSRAGFLAWGGNQSMRAIVARMLGSLGGSQAPWLVIDVLTVAAGLAIAWWLDRKGQRMAGLLVTALTGLLASPISWDHHWVWIVPCVALVGHYAVQAMRAGARAGTAGQAGTARGAAASWRGWAARARLWSSSGLGWACWALAALIVATFGAWPGAWFGHPNDAGQFSLGFIFIPPGTGMGTYEQLGDLPRYAEYHWGGASLLLGNAYVLAGVGLLLLAALLAWYLPYPVTAVRPVTQRASIPAVALNPAGAAAAQGTTPSLDTLSPDTLSVTGDGNGAFGGNGGEAARPGAAAAGQSAGSAAPGPGVQSPAAG